MVQRNEVKIKQLSGWWSVVVNPKPVFRIQGLIQTLRVHRLVVPSIYNAHMHMHI